jgi:hypothetical protein
METTPDDYPPIDSATIAPCKKAIPDLYNFMPSRTVTLAEAKARGWTYFYEGEACRHRHMAPRWVSNPRMCVDCHRIKKTLLPIGATALTAVDTPEDESDAHGHRETPTKPMAFEWTEEKRATLIEEWVNTGDIATAKDAIGVTHSEYSRELARNETFAAQVAEAEPLANQILEERAIQLALGGNDRLLQKVLAAKFPAQYRESIKVDITQNPISRMTDEQIAARLHQLGWRPPDAIDAEVIEPVKLPAPIQN